MLWRQGAATLVAVRGCVRRKFPAPCQARERVHAAQLLSAAPSVAEEDVKDVARIRIIRMTLPPPPPPMHSLRVSETSLNLQS